MGLPTRHLPAFLALTAALLLSSCSKSPEERAVRDAFQRFLEGLDRADAAALWTLADDDTHRFFDELAVETRNAVAEVDAHWPEAERVKARRAVAGDFVGPGTTGASLFAAFLDPRRLQAPQDPSARRIDRVEITGARALVVLKSGETLELVSDASGAWRTGIFLAPARELPWLTSLRENIATVVGNAAILSNSREGHAPAPGAP
jgi:hypothetical protein